MTEQDKVTVDDIIGIVKTEEQTNSVEEVRKLRGRETMAGKRFTITQDFEEHHRQIRDNGKIIMGCFIEPQAEPIVKLLNELHEENQRLNQTLENIQKELNKYNNEWVDL